MGRSVRVWFKCCESVQLIAPVEIILGKSLKSCLGDIYGF